VTLRPPRKRDLLGVPISLTDYDGALGLIDAAIASRERAYVCAIAVHALMVSRHDPEQRAALAGATLALPDGKPLVWALNALGERLPDRVYGPDLMARSCERAAERGYRVWLYGGRDEASLDMLVAALRERYSGIQVAASWSPDPFAEEEKDAAVERIDGAGTDIVFVGLGAPRQEKWMAAMRPRLRAPVLAGVGAAFDFLAGTRRQAPPWMQRRGLEWMFRLSQEPLRLAPRYLRYNPAFVAAFARQYARERRARA
jgi:N-acetylglucosaminyldiphosphoundecaprenol N-acetyl-beta-D-mannosaminyltransferase